MICPGLAGTCPCPVLRRLFLRPAKSTPPNPPCGITPSHNQRAARDIASLGPYVLAIKEAWLRHENQMVEWITTDGLTSYEDAVSFMETRAAAIANGEADECIWLLEHPPLYTAGTSARIEDLTDPHRFPVYQAKRGGQYTYHGPGQRVIYVMLDLNRRGRDVRAFVKQLETWVIDTLAQFNLRGEIRDGRVGVWIARDDKPLTASGQKAEDKIAAIGIRLRRWVSFHGISINVEPDLQHFSGIVPCGITEHGVTSLVDLGLPVTLEDLDVALRHCFATIFPDFDADITPDTPISA